MCRRTVKVVVIGNAEAWSRNLVTRLQGEGFEVHSETALSAGSKERGSTDGDRLAGLLQDLAAGASASMVTLDVSEEDAPATGDRPDKLTFGEFVILPAYHEVQIGGRSVLLTRREFQMLCFLAERRGRVYSRSQIVAGVAGADYPVTDRSVDVQIAGLRRKLGTHGRWIQTIRGVGYRFQEPSSEDSLVGGRAAPAKLARPAIPGR